jgi:hypothetical protein
VPKHASKLPSLPAVQLLLQHRLRRMGVRRMGASRRWLWPGRMTPSKPCWPTAGVCARRKLSVSARSAAALFKNPIGSARSVGRKLHETCPFHTYRFIAAGGLQFFISRGCYPTTRLSTTGGSTRNSTGRDRRSFSHCSTRPG